MSGIFDVIYEDGDVVIVNKLAAVPTLPDKSGDSSLKDFVAESRPGRFVEPVHRLDRRTSGAVAFAKSKHSLAALSEAFRERRVTKTYWAVTERAPEPAAGTLRHRLIHDKRRNQAKAIPANGERGGDIAVLTYELVGRSDRYFLLAVRPLSGKTHQIRAQLSAAGFPVRGDLKYGARRSTRNGLIMLHARELSIEMPDRRRVYVTADPPPDEPLWEAFVEDPQNVN
ncbi:MAG TPA: RNA pseudouridine synthase [Spirochaetia bacterium]|nr:RNA pseudouridine synthase [Spirochaetaceae bacterium]HPE88795.1 RNA pseudouridine synthase [Spirochaetales bacterium]HRW24898.1 RNA pseudouridine synthase [Spirochaetia bacterium]